MVVTPEAVPLLQAKGGVWHDDSKRSTEGCPAAGNVANPRQPQRCPK